MTEEHRVVIVGAGFSGIGMAGRLRSMGIDDFVVLDRGNDLGGTWRDNSYPGCCCDVPSNLYSYSFALNPDWSRSFPPQGEIWDYLRACVDRFEVGGHLRLGKMVDEARLGRAIGALDGASGGGRRVRRTRARVGDGLSERAVHPAVPGSEGFPGEGLPLGPVEHGFDLRGKRVCVVGTGASAVQFVPQIAPVVEHVYVHQRTPPFIVPRRDRPVSRLRQRVYRKVPAIQRLSRLRIYAIFESLLSVFVGRRSATHGGRTKAITRPPGQTGARRGAARQADTALPAGLQAALTLRRLLPFAHAPQRRGGGVHRSPRSPPTRWWDRTTSLDPSTWSSWEPDSRPRSPRTPSTSWGTTARGSPRSGRRTASRPTRAPRWRDSQISS